MDRDPWTETPLLDSDSPDRDPSGQRPPRQRPSWPETALWADKPVKTLPSQASFAGSKNPEMTRVI